MELDGISAVVDGFELDIAVPKGVVAADTSSISSEGMERSVYVIVPSFAHE